MKNILILLLLSLAMISCDTTNAEPEIDSALILVQGSIQVEYTSPTGIKEKILLIREKRIDLAPEGFVKAFKFQTNITIILLSGEDEIYRVEGFDTIMTTY